MLRISLSPEVHSRMKGRVAAAKSEEENFSPNGSLLLHRNGKLLPDIHGSKFKTVDRVAVLVSGNGAKNFLVLRK